MIVFNDLINRLMALVMMSLAVLIAAQTHWRSEVLIIKLPDVIRSRK